MLRAQSARAHLETRQLRFGDGVRLGDDRNDVDFRVELLHAHQIERLQPVPGRADEVQTDVDAAVVARRQRPIDLQLLLQVGLELGVDVVDDRLERVVFVDLVAVADCVAYGQLETDAALLQLVRVRLQLDVRQSVRARRRLEARIEQRVHQRRLAQARFA